jgi:hypothetical protein
LNLCSVREFNERRQMPRAPLQHYTLPKWEISWARLLLWTIDSAFFHGRTRALANCYCLT